MATAKPSLLYDALHSYLLSEEEKFPLRYLYDTSLYKVRRPGKWPKSNITVEDLKILLRLGLAVQESDPLSFGYAFTRPEWRKLRRRFIQDTIGPNCDTAEPVDPGFSTLKQLRALVFAGFFAASIDFKCYYFQFVLAEEVSRYFCFCVEGKFYRLRRLPMGFKHAVVIAQTFTKFLIRSILSNENANDIYIDNILLVGNAKTIPPMVNSLKEMCAKYQVTIGEVQTGSKIVHRGMIFDFEKKTVQLSQSFVDKFNHRCATTTSTWGQWRSLIGMMIHGTCMLGEPLAQFFHVLKFLGKHVKTHPGQIIQLWHGAKNEWALACRMISTNNPHEVTRVIDQDTTIGAIIITDAALATQAVIAGILIVPGNRKIGTFTETVTNFEHDISTLEATAVLRATLRWKRFIRDTCSLFLIDNTPTIAALHNGFAKAFYLNVVIRKILVLTTSLRTFGLVLFIPSAHNPSDALTRLVNFSSVQRSIINWAFLNAGASVNMEWAERILELW